MVHTTYVQPKVSLDYRNGGLDRFGRTVDHAWRDASGVALVQISHDYDSTGNRTNRQDGVNPPWSETYGYDEMGQVASLHRSDLTESWQYDPTGNWMRYKKTTSSKAEATTPRMKF